MAKFFGKNAETDFASANLMSFGKSFSRLNGQPLDKSEVWYNKAELEAYALTDAAYVGQKVFYVDINNNTVTHYSIEANGTLKELGVKPVGDNKTIQVDENGVISIANIEEADGLNFPRLSYDKRKIEWVPISQIVQGDGNTTYDFELNQNETGFIVTSTDRASENMISVDLDNEEKTATIYEGAILDFKIPEFTKTECFWMFNGNSGILEYPENDINSEWRNILQNWLDSVTVQEYIQPVQNADFPNSKTGSSVWKILNYTINDNDKTATLTIKEWITVNTDIIKSSVEIDFSNTFASIDVEETTQTNTESIKTINETLEDHDRRISNNLLKEEKGAPDGLAPLDESRLIPSAYLPSYVDDVIVGYITKQERNETKNNYFSGSFYLKVSDLTSTGEMDLEKSIDSQTFQLNSDVIIMEYCHPVVSVLKNNNIYEQINIDNDDSFMDYNTYQITVTSLNNYCARYLDDDSFTFTIHFEYVTVDVESRIKPESGKIYIDYRTGKTYRYTGNTENQHEPGPSSYYVEISASLALGETESTAYSGKKGAANAAAIAVLNGDSTGSVKKTVSDAISSIPASSDTTKGLAQVDNSTIVSNDGILSVNQISTDALAQGTNTLILCGGNASGFTNA